MSFWRPSKYRSLSPHAELDGTGFDRGWSDRFASAFFLPGIWSLIPGRALRKPLRGQELHYNLQAVLRRTMNQSIPVPASSAGSTKAALDIHDILKILPHRYPFLLIDRVLELERKKRIVAIKNVTINEPFFLAHFPGLPIMPGVLIVEAIAQAGGALLLTEVEDRRDKVMMFTGIERAKFRRPVSPGDQLRLEVAVTGWRSVPGMTAAKMQGFAYVGEKRVAEAIVSCQLVDSSRGRGLESANDNGG